MYKIIGADGREYGPVPAESIRQWILERRAGSMTKVQPEGRTDWIPLQDLPEFTEALQGMPAMPPPTVAVATPTLDPGASPLPPDVGERDYTIDIGDCISRAWQLLTGANMWAVIGGTAVWLAIQMGFGMLQQIPLLGLLFLLANLVTAGPLVGGVYAFMLRWVRGQPADVGNLFDGFRFRFAQLFLGHIVVALLTFATAIPGGGLIAGGAILLSADVAQPGAIALIVAGALAALIPMIYFSIAWAMTLPLIIDKRLDFWPAMQLSRRVVGRNWWLMFALSLVVGIISGLGILACCVGMFFTVPLGFAAMCFAYEILFSQRPATPAPRQPAGS